jgi:hypothetical protein
MLDCRWTIGVLWAALAMAGCRVQGPARKCPDGSCTVARRTTENEDRPFPTAAWREVPVVNLPQHARCRNYAGGSCVIASTVSLFRWQGRDDLAELFRRAYSGGQSASSLHAKLEAHRVRYAYTTSGDATFLEWACRTRRGAGVTFFANHFVCLVHLDAERAVLLDNNRTSEYVTLPRDAFLRRWRGYGGWASTPVYSPAAPLAYVALE